MRFLWRACLLLYFTSRNEYFTSWNTHSKAWNDHFTTWNEKVSRFIYGLFGVFPTFVTIQRFFFISNAETLRRRGPFLELYGDLESKTLYECFEVCHWLTCRPKLCALRTPPIGWKASLRLSVSAFFIMEVFRWIVTIPPSLLVKRCTVNIFLQLGG